MNKTVSVNISGFIFNIEETAFEKLNRYLNTIRGYFSESTGAEEIIEDIEARIAELFQEKITTNYQVIKLKDVNEVIEIMGQPEEYIDGEVEEEEINSGRATYSSAEPKNRYRKIYRDADDKVLGGVCSGIGYYFGIDPIWIRLMFVALFITFGTGFLLYIILWIIIPKAMTASEKLEMKGNPVTAENIGKQVEEELGNIKKKFKNYKDGAKPIKDRPISKGANEVGGFLGKILRLLFNSLGKVIGFIFIVLGLGVIVTLLLAIGNSGEFLNQYTMIEGFSISYHEMVDLFPHNVLTEGWSKVLIFLIVGLPFIALTFLGFNMLTNFVYKIRGFGLALFLIWFIASIAGVFQLGFVAKDYVQEFNKKEVYKLEQVTGDTLTIEVSEDDIYYFEHNQHRTDYNDFIQVIDDRIYLGNPELDIKRSNTDEFQLVFYKESRGKSRKEAHDNIRDVEYDYMEIGNLISFSPYFSIPKENGYHFEQLKIRLLVPIGKSVYLHESTERIIYDIENVTNTWDPYMIEKVWTMTKDGLECIDCDPDEL
jgi:phage shock protein PspC (stress-responsive transcriptional regulator)